MILLEELLCFGVQIELSGVLVEDLVEAICSIHVIDRATEWETSSMRT